jgi:hypothetical protein
MAAKRIGRQILGTFIAVLAGWVASLVFLLANVAVQRLQDQHDTTPLLDWFLVYGFFAALFIIPVWLFVLIPLYLFVPASSILWRWPICTTCGVIAGLIVIGLFYRGIPGVGGLYIGLWYHYIMAAIVGGMTCLVGALTRHRFKTTTI